MNIINPERYQRLIQEAQEAGFSGWNFNWLNGRMQQDEPPWEYANLVRKYFKSASSLLDMGTGGGEFLAALTPLPPDTHATESYLPNQTIAEARLSTLGVRLHHIREEQPLPFNNGFFDLVINRHDSYDPEEVYQVLKPGGSFITQQVGGLDNLELNQILEDKLSFPFTQWSLAAALTGLYKAGFDVERAEKAALASRFTDIGAVIYYLKAIPWQVPNFSPETHRAGLVRLHNIIEQQGQFLATAHRFLVIARRPGYLA